MRGGGVLWGMYNWDTRGGGRLDWLDCCYVRGGHGMELFFLGLVIVLGIVGLGWSLLWFGLSDCRIEEHNLDPLLA